MTLNTTFDVLYKFFICFANKAGWFKFPHILHLRRVYQSPICLILKLWQINSPRFIVTHKNWNHFIAIANLSIIKSDFHLSSNFLHKFKFKFLFLPAVTCRSKKAFSGIFISFSSPQILYEFRGNLFKNTNLYLHRFCLRVHHCSLL